LTAVEEHRAHAPTDVACGVVTISDSRTEATDESGELLKRILREARHAVVFYAIVKDDGPSIVDAVDRAEATCDVVITNGGTGLAARDVTIETLAPRLEKVLPGFGELFRMLSFSKIGSAAMMSRALAGVYKGSLVFCLPGSPQACELALTSLILPEIGHAVGVMRR
jgi:molybdenum cofactor biosynthesis protein B